MFLDISKISTSNVLKIYLNIIVGIGCTSALFRSHKSTGSKEYPGQKERNIY